MTAKSRLRSMPFETNAVDGNRVLVNLTTTPTQDLIDPALARLLASCASFETIPKHTDEFWAQCTIRERVHLTAAALKICLAKKGGLSFGPGMFKRSVGEALNDLKEKGFLIDFDTFGELMGPPESLSEPSKITAVSIVTKNRAATLGVCLESYVSNSLRFGRKPRFTTLDDSEHRDTADVISALQKKNDVLLHYAGRREKNEFIARLAQAGIPPSVLQFALFGWEGFPSYGANRNAFLLDSAGELSFSADDDTRCTVARPKSVTTGLKLGYQNSREQVFTYRNRDDIFKENPVENVDFLADHEKYLGRSINDVILKSLKEAPEGLDTHELSGDFLKTILERKSRVLLSLPGLVGDSGSTSPEWLMFASDEMFDRLIADRERFDISFSSREICKTSQKTLLFPTESLMAGFFGLDNRNLVPPFFPILREEDSLFGFMAGTFVKGACTLQSPLCLLHSPVENRSYPHLEHDSNALTITPLRFIQAEILRSQFSAQKMDAALALKAVGDLLIASSKMDRKEFTNALWLERARMLTARIRSLAGTIERNVGAPSYWKNMAQKILRSYDVLFAQHHIRDLVHYELVEKFGEDGAVEHFQKLLGQYGELLTWWPSMIEITKDLKKKNIPLSRPIQDLK